VSTSRDEPLLNSMTHSIEASQISFFPGEKTLGTVTESYSLEIYTGERLPETSSPSIECGFDEKREDGWPLQNWFSHSSRMSHLAATGITIYLENHGRLEHAQQMAGHESPRRTKLYDRTKDEITLS
jgi:hypothetical protein